MKIFQKMCCNVEDFCVYYRIHLTKVKNIQNKVKVNRVIDEKVYCLENDPEFKNSIALPKDDFAQLIYDQDKYSFDFDFSEFKKIFDVIREVVDL